MRSVIVPVNIREPRSLKRAFQDIEQEKELDGSRDRLGIGEAQAPEINDS